MGGHHKNPLPKIPNYQDYRVEDVPQLMEVQRRLCQLGLRDNWLRNEVWRYTEDLNKYTRWQRMSNTLFVGLKYGFIAALITAGLEFTFLPIRQAPTYGDHGHH